MFKLRNLLKSMESYVDFRITPTPLCLFNNLTLTHLVLGVLLVNNEQAALATYNLAIWGTLLQ